MKIIAESLNDFNLNKNVYRKIVSFIKNLKETYPDVNLVLSVYKTENKNYTLYLDKIAIQENNRKKGLGTEILNKICDFCDKENIMCSLEPTDFHGSDLVRLINFYERFNFKLENKYNENSKDLTMVRCPNQIKTC